MWGGLHGVGIIVSKLISPVTNKAPNLIRRILTFSFVSLAWVFFRADDTTVALSMLSQLFAGGLKPLNSELIAACIPTECQLLQWIILKAAPDLTYYSGCAIWIGLVLLSIYLAMHSKTVKERCGNFVASNRKIVCTVILFTWSVLSLSEVAEFIYVNF